MGGNRSRILADLLAQLTKNYKALHSVINGEAKISISLVRWEWLMKATLKSSRRKFHRVLLGYILGSMYLVSLTAAAQPARFLELAGWFGGERSAEHEAGGRMRNDRSGKRGDAAPDYQPRERRDRMSPEDRIQLRRDVRDAGRDIYPEERRGRHRGGRGGERDN
jgi:hypothetical protein